MTKFFSVPFAETGDKISPPNPTQADGTVSYTQGFGYDYQRKTDGTDPLAKDFPREQFNGIVNDITGAVGEIQLNGLTVWQDLTPKISYPVNAMVRYADKNWVSLVANNTATPAEGASWADIAVDTYTKVQIDGKLLFKADKATTLSGYGITDAYTQSQTDTLLVAKAPLASPSFTGIPEAPTATPGTSSLQLATTAFVTSAVGPVPFSSGAYFSGVVAVTTNGATLGSANVAMLNAIYGAASTINMASSATVTRNGSAVTIQNQKTTGLITISSQGADRFSVYGAGVSSVTIAPGEWATFVRVTGNLWYVFGNFTELGTGQSWQVVTGSRSSGTTYTNSSIRPIYVLVTLNGGSMSAVCDGLTVISSGLAASLIVPPGGTYSVTAANIGTWAEFK